MQDFRKLNVWQKAHALSLKVGRLAQKIRARKASLANQMERAADSIAANIAEGRAADSDAEFARFLTMGIRSATELENHLERGRGGGLIHATDYEERTADTIEVRRMLIGLRKVLRGNNQ